MGMGRTSHRFGSVRRIVSIVVLLGAALAGCVATPPPPQAGRAPIPLRLVALNDFHGQLEPGGLTLRLRDPGDPSRMLNVGAGGAAQLGTLVRRLRAEVPNTLVVSAGDLVGATPIASALFRDEPTVEVMNLIGVDLGAVGNHEFDRGFAELRRLIAGGCHPGDASPAGSCAGPDGAFRGARFPMLAANVRDSAGRAVLPASIVRDVGGVKVAFIGAVLRATPTVVVPAGVAGLVFEDEADAVNREVARLKASAGIEAFVAVIHEGGAIDGDWNDARCPGARGPIFAIADRLRPEVDAVLSGHSHLGYACLRDAPGNPRLPVVQAFANGRAVSVVDLQLDPATGDVLRARTVARNLPVANGLGGDRAADAAYPPLPPDPAVRAIVEHYAARAKPLAERPVGRIAAAATRDPSPGGDTPLGRLVADAHLAATRSPDRGGARLALTNPGGMRADLRCDAGPCEVRYADAFAAQPFGNSLVVMTLTGAQILAVLEQQFTGVNAARPRVLQPSAGFEIRWRASATPGARIVEARLDGVPIDPAVRYRVTVNSFLADGGDGFETFRAGTNRLGGDLDVDALIAWLGATPTLEVPRAARVQRLE